MPVELAAIPGGDATLTVAGGRREHVVILAVHNITFGVAVPTLWLRVGDGIGNTVGIDVCLGSAILSHGIT